jgi:selenocysteine lyase/cysteine desulfurase
VLRTGILLYNTVGEVDRLVVALAELLRFRGH